MNVTRNAGVNGVGGRIGAGGANTPANIGKQNMLLKDMIILATHIHCQGCASDIIKCLKGFEGVEDVKVNSKEHRILVKGKQADPLKVLERVRIKCTNKHVELIYPLPKPKPKPEPKFKETEDDNEPLVMIIVLEVLIHCENCAQETKACILKMNGVRSVTVDASKKQMTVIGGIEPQNLVKYLYDKAGKHAMIVKQEYQDKEKASKRIGKVMKKESKGTNQGISEAKGDQTKKDKKFKDVCYQDPWQQYNPDQLNTCLVFSDENPHACGIM